MCSLHNDVLHTYDAPLYHETHDHTKKSGVIPTKNNRNKANKSFIYFFKKIYV